jgi:hypothetical protein
MQSSKLVQEGWSGNSLAAQGAFEHQQALSERVDDDTAGAGISDGAARVFGLRD